MDAISDILRIVGLTGGVFLDAEFTAPWAIAGQMAPEMCGGFMEPPQQVLGYHYVIDGWMEVRLDDGSLLRLGPGEAIMLPHNDPHVFGSATRLPTVTVADLMPPDAQGIAKIVHGGGGERTRLICGFLGGNDRLRPLLAELPAALVIPVAQLPGGDWLSRTFSYAAETLAGGDPGGPTVIARLSELLFVESMRRYLADLPSERTGWLAALRDPAIGRALALLHARIAEDWTTEDLASAVNMSRSAFADRFTTIVGQPPMRYLTTWRMQLARQRLAETHASVAQIGYEIGYTSEAAFTRAFRRENGTPPATWRRQLERA